MTNKIKATLFDFKNNFFFLLLCIYPCALISGPFLADTIGVILTIYFITKSVIQKNFEYYTKIYFVLFILFCIFISLNSIFNAQNFVSIKSSITYFRFGLFALAIHYILKSNHEKLKIFFYCLILTLFILSLDSIIQKIFGFNIIGLEVKNQIRISSFFGDELILGSFIVKILPITLAFMIYLNKEVKLYKILTILIASLIPILLSAEKNAFISFILFSFFIIFFINYKIKIKMIMFFIIISTIFSIFSIDKNIKFRLINHYGESMMSSNSIYTAVHLSHFKTAYKMYLDKPINGHGSKMFRFKCSDQKYIYDEFSCSTHPHNFYLQIMAETGLIGLFFVLFFYLCLISIFFKSIFFKKISILSHKLPHSIITCSLLITFLPISTSGSIFNNWLSAMNFFSIGILLFFIEENKTEKI